MSSRLEIGRLGTDIIKSAFTDAGFHISNDKKRRRSNQFQVSNTYGRYFTIQPKTISNYNYPFMQKKSVELSSDFYMALLMLKEGAEPSLFLIPSEDWKKPDDLLVDRPYKDLGSPPEWGVRVSGKNMQLLEEYLFSKVTKKLWTKKVVT